VLPYSNYVPSRHGLDIIRSSLQALHQIIRRPQLPRWHPISAVATPGGALDFYVQGTFAEEVVKSRSSRLLWLMVNNIMVNPRARQAFDACYPFNSETARSAF
jgi:hypothetical protein